MTINFASGELALAICDRCKRKRPYLALGPDGDKPGLRVCQDDGCSDVKDPWRLPAIQPEPITLRYPRPDTDISTANDDTQVFVNSGPNS